MLASFPLKHSIYFYSRKTKQNEAKNLGNTDSKGFCEMLIIQSGDLLRSDCQIIAHQCNCFATMGAGIARQIKLWYPEAYQADKDGTIPVGSKKRLGTVSSAIVDGGRRVVFNLYGQYHYGTNKQQTDYEALEKALQQMFFVINRRMPISHWLYPSNTTWDPEWDPKWKGLKFSGPILKIGMPYRIGCGLAGGDWNKVEEILLSASEKYMHDIYLYKL